MMMENFNVDSTLVDILSLRRAHGSSGEAEFVERYLKPIQNLQALMNDKDEVIAYVVSVGTSKVLWSCHIDTMHKEGGGVEQEIYVDAEGLVFVTDKQDCLGADDGAGAWLMLEMIKAGCQGNYIFHRGEERGCWGSRQVVEFHEDWLKQFTHAIAFDRRGTTSIITHQRGERGCSDKLAEQLIGLFNLEHVFDPTGVYTDTAEYMDIIPECVNVSIGYQSEHSNRETLDAVYVHALRDVMVSIDWSKVELVAERDPSVREYDRYDAFGSWGNKWGGYSSYGIGGYDTYSDISVNQVMTMDYTRIKQLVKDSSNEDITWLIMDLVDKIAEMEYDLDYYTSKADDLDGDDKLDVGMR